MVGCNIMDSTHTKAKDSLACRADGAGANGQGTPRFAAYGSTKHAIVQLNRSLAQELKEAKLDHKIQVRVQFNSRAPNRPSSSEHLVHQGTDYGRAWLAHGTPRVCQPHCRSTTCRRAWSRRSCSCRGPTIPSTSGSSTAWPSQPPRWLTSSCRACGRCLPASASQPCLPSLRKTSASSPCRGRSSASSARRCWASTRTGGWRSERGAHAHSCLVTWKCNTGPASAPSDPD